MLLTIHGADMQKIGWIDNDKQSTLNYFDDKWVRDLPSGSSVFEFTAIKKKLQTDVGRDYLFEQLNERAFVSFSYKGRSYIFNIMEVEEDATTIKCYCENLNLEMINEYANPYQSTKALTFKEACLAMELLQFSYLRIGINEIKSIKKPIEFTQQETKLARLIALANEFNAEIDFETVLNADSTIKDFVLNVYHAHDSSHQGVGVRRDDLVLRYGKNMQSIKRKVSKTNVFNVIYPIGKRSEVTKSKKTTVINPDGTTTVTEKVSVSDAKSTTTTTVYSTSGAVVSSKTVTATKNADGTVSRNYSESKGSSTVTSTSSTVVKENPDKSTTKTTTVRKSDGTVQKTIVHTKKEEHTDKSTKTTVTTTKADGSVTERITLRYPNGTSSTSSRIIKAGSSSSSTKVTKVDESSDEEFDLSELKDWSQNNSSGVQEFYKRGPAIYAPLSVQLYPSTFMASTGDDQWIRRDKEFDADSVEELNALAYQYLKEHCYPEITYSISGFVDGDIGDTIRIEDSSFANMLILSARIERQEISFTNPSRNQTQVSNIKAIGNKLSKSIQQRLDELIEDTKPFKIRFSTDNGLIFKNHSGQTLVTPSLTRAGRPISSGVSWRWLFNDKVTTGATFIVNAADITDTAVLSVAAYIGNTEVVADEITFANVSDGERGEPGQTAHVHIAWADNDTGTEGFSLTNSSGKSYMGIYTDFDAANSTDPTKYKWVKTKGSLDNEQLADINAKIDAKLDANLTQEQMNMLNERLQLMEVEAQAKASMENFSELEKQFLAFVAANAEGVAKSEEDLVAIAERVEKMVLEFGGMKELKTFIDTYMSSSEEGMVIGRNDGSSVIKVSNDRISMFSAGKEVMYISQGVINIDNGIFTASVQIGRFRTEEYHFNPDVNVIRYVGNLDVV